MITSITLTRSSGEEIRYVRPPATKLLPFAVWLAAAGIGSLTNWGWYWLAWMFAGFLVPELYCLVMNIHLGPLSNNVWSWEDLNFAHPFDFASWTPAHWGLAILVWGLFAWLSIHLPFGLAR
jgi:hypothetical protein